MGHMACGAPAVSTLLSLFSQLRPPPPPPPHPTPSQSQKCSQNFTIHTLLTFLTLPFDSLHILLPPPLLLSSFSSENGTPRTELLDPKNFH